MDQGTATILAALLAILGAVGGVWVGGRISAGAAREAAKIAADATREAALVTKAAADADREAARAARFADRLCDLGARALAISDRWVKEVAAMRDQPSVYSSAELPIGAEFAKVSQELRLLVRLAESFDALTSLWDCTSYLPQAAVADAKLWHQSLAQQGASRTRFEDAIRAELGRDAVSRPWFVKRDGKYADGH